jgi:hypothetical protein
MGRDKMKQLREIVCQESESLDDAFTYEECKELYLRLIKDGIKESIAKQETLKLFNEAQWLACQEILQVTVWVTRKFDDIALSHFSEEDVGVLAKKMPRQVPTKRIWFAHDSTKESFPVKYKSYDKWGEHCLYRPYDVTKGYTDDLLVELLYESTGTEDGKMKLLNDIIEDARRMWEDPEREPGYVWALLQKEQLEHYKKSSCKRRKTNEDKKSNLVDLMDKYGEDKIKIYEDYLEKLKEHEYIVEQDGKYKLNVKKKITTLKMKKKYIAIWHDEICRRIGLFYKSQTPWAILVHYIYDEDGNAFNQTNIKNFGPDVYILKQFEKDGLFPEETDLNQ